MGEEFKANLGSLMKEAQKMQKHMQDAQKALASLEVDGESGGGLVKIRMNGRHHILHVDIDPQLLTPDQQKVLQELFAAAVNDASNKLEQESTRRITELASDFNFPTDLNLGEIEEE